MAEKKYYSDFSNRKPINDVPLKEGEVLVPVHALELVKAADESVRLKLAKPGELLNKNNLETWHLGGRKILVGFAPVAAEHAEVATKAFWDDVNEYIELTRKKRCLIPNGKGELIRCPKCNDCNKCDNKGNADNITSRTVSLDKMLDDINNEDANGYDPTGTTENEELALFMMTINDLIHEVSEKYPEADSILHLIIDGYQKKEIIEKVDLGRGKTQAYSYIEKIQKYAKEVYENNYR